LSPTDSRGGRNPSEVLGGKKNPRKGIDPFTSVTLRGRSHLLVELEGYNYILPGFGELEVGEDSLRAVLNSLVTSFKDSGSPIHLLTYIGRSVVAREGPSGCPNFDIQSGEGSGKDFTWSKGLGIELSPLKTRSA